MVGILTGGVREVSNNHFRDRKLLFSLGQGRRDKLDLVCGRDEIFQQQHYLGSITESGVSLEKE